MIFRRTSLVLAAMVLVLSGCGDDATTSPPAAPPAAGQATSAAAAADDCAGVADTVKQHLGAAEVTAVEVVGQCTTVAIKTNLTDDQSSTAKTLCNSAAEVAYTGDINSVRVTAASGKELANGIPKLPCLGQAG